MSNTKWIQDVIFMHIHTHIQMCVSVMIKEEKVINLRGSGRDMGRVGEEAGGVGRIQTPYSCMKFSTKTNLKNSEC